MDLTLKLKRKKTRHSLVARVLHWLYAPSVLTCIWSGFYINRPAKIYGFRNMNSAQKAHFIAQFTLIFAFLARVYYAFQKKNYKEILPNRQTIQNLPRFVRYELFLNSKKPQFPKYNPGQKLLFTGFVLLLPLQILTGLALYLKDSWSKTIKMVKDLNYLRQLHFLVALGNAILVAGHLYFVFTQGFKTLKSIFTGYN